MPDLRLQHDVPLAPLTTLELGGRAKHFVRAADPDTLVAALEWARRERLSVAVMGGGSNVIVSDRGYDGLVIHMGLSEIEFRKGGIVVVGAGVPWELVVDGAVTRGLAGLECLTGIPGSTGATPIQNVGAYGQEVADAIDRVDVLNRETLEFEQLSREDCAFSYRDSMFKRDPGRYVVTTVHFQLRPEGPGTVAYAELADRVGPGASLAEIRSAVLDLRRKKSMVIDPDDPNRRSAGSFFLNPIVTEEQAARVVDKAVAEGLVTDGCEVPQYAVPGGSVKLAAGWLIERSGVAKGTRRGAVGVSDRHALALVHHGGGSAAELLALADEIRDRVLGTFGIGLEREPRLLG